MTGLGLGISNNRPIGASLSPEWLAITQRATDEGFTLPSAKVQRAASAFLTGLEDEGIKSKTTYLGMFKLGASLTDFARINWVDPEGTLATKNSGAVNTNGLVGNGTAWATNLVGTDVFNVNGRRNFFFFEVTAAASVPLNNPIWGLSNTRAFTRVFADNANMRPLSQTNQAINFSGLGVHGVNILLTDTIQQWNNEVRGTDRAQGTVTLPAAETVSLFLDPPSSFGTARLGFMIMGNDFLTGDQVTALFSLYNAYETAIA